MSRPQELPEHPNLDHLRRQAKALRDAARAGEPDALARIARHAIPRADTPVALSTAQWVIAREYGFPSWPRLKAEVDERVLGLPARVRAFLSASVGGRMRTAEQLLDERVALFDIRTAAVLGDAHRVRELLPTAGPDQDWNWPPLLYACHSHWHRVDPARAAGLVAVVEALLDAGASPDTSNSRRPGRRGYRSALYGAAGIANNPAVTELLLKRGADPNDDESLYHSVGFRDHACLRVLLAHGAQILGSNALANAVEHGDADAVRLLLAADADPGHAAGPQLADRSTNPLTVAHDETTAMLLLDAGANPNATTWDEIPVLRQAIRRGNTGIAAALRRAGAVDDSVPVDHFLGACLRADRAEALRLRPDQLSDVDLSMLISAVADASTAAVALLLDLGLLVDDRDELGQTALHQAAYAGRTETVRLLLDHGAEVDALDSRFEATPLCYATVGSGESDADRDWIGTIHTLVAAGASLHGVWIEDKPPSEDVAAVLAEYGVAGPDEEAVEDVDPAVLRSVADRLRTALADEDAGLLRELLDPNVRWGTCTGPNQVMAWFQRIRDNGARSEIIDVELRADTIVLRLVMHADGLAEQVRQGYRVSGTTIVDIRDLFDETVPGR